MINSNLMFARMAASTIASMPVAAAASQGPGGGLGTAGHLTQLVMAMIVYGGCAVIVAAGLIGGLRHQVR